MHNGRWSSVFAYVPLQRRLGADWKTRVGKLGVTYLSLAIYVPCAQALKVVPVVGCGGRANVSSCTDSLSEHHRADVGCHYSARLLAG